MFSVLVVAVLSGCGGGGGGGGGDETVPPAANLSGTWNLKIKVTTEDSTNFGCPTAGTTRNFTGVISQTTGDNNFTVTGSGGTDTGSISGDQVSMSSSNAPYNGGFISFQTSNATLVTSPTSSWQISGTAPWQWSQTSGGATYCNGSSDFSAICTTCTHT